MYIIFMQMQIFENKCQKHLSHLQYMYLTPSHQNPVIYLIANVTQSSSQTRCDRHLFWSIFGVCLLPSCTIVMDQVLPEIRFSGTWKQPKNELDTILTGLFFIFCHIFGIFDDFFKVSQHRRPSAKKIGQKMKKSLLP